MNKIPSFFMKIAIAWPRMIQIPKFWCLKSCTNIWPSFRNIYSVPKVIKIYSEGRKGAKPAKICTFFTLQKIKIAFSQKFPKVWFDGFFLWLPTYETFHISLTNILKQDRCDWRDARVACSSYQLPTHLTQYLTATDHDHNVTPVTKAVLACP